MSRGTSQAVGGDGAHEEAVVASQGHGDGGRGRSGDRAIIAQNVVGLGTGYGRPLEGYLLRVAVGGAQVGGHGGGGGAACGHAHPATGPLAGCLGTVGEVEVTADPQGTVITHFEGPGTGGSQGGQTVGGPADLTASGLIPSTDPLDLVGARPGVAESEVLVGVLESVVGAVAGAVDDAGRRGSGRLQVAAILHSDGTGGAGHVGGVVAKQRVLGATEVDTSITDGDSLLVLADEVGVAEGPGLVELSSRTGAQAGGIFGNEVVCASEVACSVEVGVVLVHVDVDDGTVELGVPRAIGLAGQVQAGTVTGVHGGGAVTRQVGEGTGQVDVFADDLRGFNGHNGCVAVADLQVPRGINLAGGSVDQDGSDVGFTVDLGEVTDCQQLTAGQLDKVLHLVVKIEGLAGPVTGGGIEGCQATAGGLRAVLALLHAGEVTADVHGGADLFEGLDLDTSLLDRAVEVTGHAPRRGGRKFGDRCLLGLSGSAAVTDGAERGVRGTQLGTDVDLRVGIDDGAVAVEERRRGGGVVPGGREGTIAEAHRVLVLRRGNQVDVAPAGVRTKAGPHDAAVDPPLAVELDVDGVGALEGPDEVAHLGELHAHGLVGAAPVVPGTLDHDSVREVRNFGAPEQSVHSLVGRLDDLEVAGSARAGLEASLVSLALAPGFPAFTTATDHDPAATVRRLVAEELAGGVHCGRLEPVGAVRRARVVLFNLPA